MPPKIGATKLVNAAPKPDSAEVKAFPTNVAEATNRMISQEKPCTVPCAKFNNCFPSTRTKIMTTTTKIIQPITLILFAIPISGFGTLPKTTIKILPNTNTNKLPNTYF